jgi:DNA-binding MarR family transcriptional regulator
MMGTSAIADGKGFTWQPGALLIAADQSVSESSTHLLNSLGARLLAKISLAEAALELPRAAPVDLLLVEAVNALDDDVAAVIDVVVPYADVGNVAVVLTIDHRHIDLASALLPGGRTAVLCAPDAATRFGALAIALASDRGVRFNDATREAESVRLQRLNEEVARIAEVLARLTREPRTTVGTPVLGDRTLGYRSEPGDETPPVTASEVRQMIRARRLRDHFFGNALFEDPAWDMLLDLYAAQLERAQVSVSSLCIAAAVAPTTALRWIGRMTDAGLFERHPDPFDRRRAYIALSSHAGEAMRGYFAAAKRGGQVIF